MFSLQQNDTFRANEWDFESMFQIHRKEIHSLNLSRRVSSIDAPNIPAACKIYMIPAVDTESF